MYLLPARDHSYFQVDIFSGPCITARKKDRKKISTIFTENMKKKNTRKNRLMGESP